MSIKHTILKSGMFLIIIASIVYLAVNAFILSNQTDSTQAKNDLKYSLIKIYTVSDQDIQRLIQSGLEIDHATGKKGYYIETWLSEEELKLLINSGVPYETVIDDWDTYYNNRQNLMTPDQIEQQQNELRNEFSISHSIYGTLNNGCLRYNEVVAKLDSLRLQYPNLVSVKWSIGNSYESRAMWVVRITKNPDAPTGRPEVLLHALIHAREPESMEQQLYYIYWLLENYNINPTATYILNNREIYWMPVYNPDGYVYNEPGGGMWRKNRQPCTGGTGTDLNRNYGIYQFWNSPNGGSGTTCNSDTYRGSLPFSCPEVNNILLFTNSRNFKTALTAHTYGNYLIRPWAWNNSPTPDEAIFEEYSVDMANENMYAIGRPMETVNYETRGGSDDWNYNDSGHSKIIEMTPETGTQSDGFWPTQARVIPLAQGMVLANQYMSLAAGPFVKDTKLTFNLNSYSQGQAGTFKVNIRNKGLLTANNVKILWTPVNSYITIPTQQYSKPSMPSMSNDSNTFNFTVAANAPINCAIPTILSIKIDTSIIFTKTVYVNVGSGTITLNDGAENGTTNWTMGSGWTVHTDSYHSGTHSFAIAPYSNNANTSMTKAGVINTLSYPVTYLNFWTRWDLEGYWDFGIVEISSNNGTSWQQISTYTRTNLTWTQQSFDVTAFVNSSTQMLIRFRLTADGGTVNAGWWVDDISFTNYCVGLIGTGNPQSVLPKTFALEQNYPNPFNPVTSIKYQLPKAEFVTIKLFDILGREVATLVNERKDAGFFQFEFDASNYASGLYFYKIEAGDFVETKKMMLVK
jgi:hypothetical protein